MDVQGCTLIQTCGACPEQYDVKLGDLQIGYLRLRHGWFRADYGDCGGPTVYETEDCEGDGVFTDEERGRYLEAAVSALLAHHRNNI